MKKLKRLALGVFLLGISAFQNFAQNFNGCEYIRKLEVDKKSKVIEEKNKIPKFDVMFKEALEDESQNYLDGKILNVYFATNKFNLTANDSIDLRRYLLCVLKPYCEYEKIKSFTIEGYTDCRGNDSINNPLSFNRAISVADYFKKQAEAILPSSVKMDFYVSAFGKSQSQETMDSLKRQKDRVVKIIPNMPSLEQALNLCEADIYLLDQSGSMEKNNAWRQLQNYQYPDSSEVYSFSKVTNDFLNEKNDTIDTIPHIKTKNALGKTSYYLALDTLISSTPENKIVTTVVNEGDNIGGSNPEKIVKKANEKNIKLNIVGLNIDNEYSVVLRNIVNQTEGKYYFFRKFTGY